MVSLTDPVRLAGAIPPSRVVFGPHETNLARGRALADRAVAYYAERAAGGTGVLVTEIASVTEDDWPYERAPLAAECGPGWAAIADACRRYGTVVLAGLGHAGLQGSSAYSQQVLWAPSSVADVVTREQPAAMEQPQIDAVVAAFGAAAAAAVDAGLAGVELNAGANSLLRQFLSGLTNQRLDRYGTDRSRFLRDVIAAVRAAVGPDRVLALRLSCDEDAPWAGLTPVEAAAVVDAVAGSLDLLTVVRAGHYSSARYRPTARTAPTFNRDLCRTMRTAAAGRVPVVLQGSVVDPAAAQRALDEGVADLVEMTRAQIAEPRLVTLVRGGAADRVRPCVLCNQACQVRDVRNPLVSCVAEPRAGHETVEPEVAAAATGTSEVLVVGGGPAGLEAARVLALRGHRVRLAARSARLGGALRTAAHGPGRERLRLLVEWLEAECRRLGVDIRLDTDVDLTALGAEQHVVLAVGSRSATGDRAAAWREAARAESDPDTASAGESVVLDVLEVLAGSAVVPPGAVVLDDPIGGPVAVALAEYLADAGHRVHVVTPDPVLGARTPELADANFRLEALGVHRELRTRIRSVAAGAVVLEHVWTGARRRVACAAIVDCGHRLPDDTAGVPDLPRAGDCVAPRTALEAVLDGRRAALAVDGGPAKPLRVGPETPRSAQRRGRPRALRSRPQPTEEARR
ncbi:mycofactocin system FadH/OYE family oxidoreductase 1 [Cryptosporangium minutisporangium]|uniref:mycofactocin system FadH/OYE family oxidoreductase 1 n=1 Tax=Cryptosporangium minutisporangium TaxID=113569 RepID=UPI0035EAD9B4